jgi:hypothetical protein
MNFLNAAPFAASLSMLPTPQVRCAAGDADYRMG